MPAKPMLDAVALQQVAKIEGDHDEIFNQHQIPGLEGDLLQDLGRQSVRIRLCGTLTGPDAAKGLETLRTKFRAGVPVAFVADIATATTVTKVLIEELAIREAAGKPQRTEYALTLVEFLAQPKKSQTPTLTPPPLPRIDEGTLILEITANGQRRFNFNQIVVTVEGVSTAGEKVIQVLGNHSDNIWTAEKLPPGLYAATAALTDPPQAGASRVTILPAQTTRVTLTLRPTPAVARKFVVHFAYGKAFVEPAMRPVLQEVVEYARTHPNEELVIVGHTDPMGAATINRSLSEQRAGAVFTYLTHFSDPHHSTTVWDAARRARSADPDRSWRAREYQLMLQDLGYCVGEIDRDPIRTGEAVRDFQLDHDLTPSAVVDDVTWYALIRAYLDKAPAGLPDYQLSQDRWIGLADQIPVKSDSGAWRPNRRVELLFVPAGTPVNTRHRWMTVPAAPSTVIARGSMRFEDGRPAPGIAYVLTAPDGEYMDGEQPSGPERGMPIPGFTAADGSFAYRSKPNWVGYYTLEVLGPFVVRLENENGRFATSTQVTKRLDGNNTFDVILSRRNDRMCPC